MIVTHPCLVCAKFSQLSFYCFNGRLGTLANTVRTRLSIEWPKAEVAVLGGDGEISTLTAELLFFPLFSLT